jgi:hypothetical protein
VVSAIEFSAARYGINWGACHFYNFSHLNCSSADWKFPERILEEEIPFNIAYNDVPWHMPPHCIRPNFYGNLPKFTVVRNPVSIENKEKMNVVHVFSSFIQYNRIASMYNCFWSGYDGEKASDMNVFNSWITLLLKDYRTNLSSFLIPQYYYVYNNQIQVIEHILHYENLEKEFSKLMASYSLPIQLVMKTNNTVFKKSNSMHETEYLVSNLSPENILLIDDVYEKDFHMLNYTQKKIWMT